ncbi:hypothetical protein HY008_00785 [Candidatus Woesebacteria bacterium]|nr:hypothetical protein [Candidatus Woesebacteria bacterium]
MNERRGKLANFFRQLDKTKKESIRFRRKEARRKGGRSEQIVDTALDLLIDEQKITSWWPCRGKQDTREGIDRIVMKLSGSEEPLQIKSSFFHRKLALKKHPDVT